MAALAQIVAAAGVLAGPTGPIASRIPLEAGSTRSLRASARDLFRMARQLQSAGRFGEARSILELLEQDPVREIRIEARFRRALLLRSLREDREAAILLRRVVDDMPVATAARLELARTLHSLGDVQAALRELRALRSADLPPTVARFVDRLSASLQANRRFGVQLELALAPDSNINRATRSDTLGTIFGDFTIDQEKQSGLGLAARGFAQSRLPLSGTLNLLTRASGEANLYRDKDFSEVLVDLSAGPELLLGANRLTIEGAVGQHWYGMKPYQRTYRLSAALVRPVGPVMQLRVDAGARRADNKVNNLQDGNGLAIRFRLERAMSPRLLVAASVGADRFHARDDAYSTRSWSAGAAAYRDIGRLTVSAAVDLGRLKADERLSLLPRAREDRLVRIQLGLVHRQLTVAGFAPITRLVIERNRSTVEFYDYKRTRTEIGLSRAF